MTTSNTRIGAILEYLDIESTPEDRARREQLVEDILPEDMTKLGKVYDRALVRRLFFFIGPYRTKVYFSMFLMVISSIASAIKPLLIGRALDYGVGLADLSALRYWSAMFAVAALIRFATHRGQLLTMADVSARIVADVRSAMFRHLQTLSLNFFNQYSVGRLMSRLIGDVSVLRDFVTWSITGVVYAGFSLLAIIGFMFYENWRLAIVALMVMPIIVSVANYWRKYARAAYIRTRMILSHINGYLNESIGGIRVTKSFTREERNMNHFDDLNRSHFESIMSAEFLSAIFFPSIEFFSYFTTALIVGVGGWLVLGDQVEVGALVAFILWINRFFDPIRELARRLSTFQATMASSERIFNLLDTESDIVDAPDAVVLQDVEGRVVFDDVSFHYKPEEPVLRGISLTAEPGERIAFVGETGAGKSTIIRLLSRFFDITDGTITIDGHEIRDITRSSLRQNLGIVLQDTFLFSGTILDNIRYGRLEATDEEVYDAARAVGAYDFIMYMPDGFQTDVGENGLNLSVGQRQIVSFARALIADPRILILDEATSSVDTATELVIEGALERLMKGRTSFVIAHRLSTIINSDKIVVLDAGKIVESGTHEALLGTRGRYYNLYTMQWAATKQS